MFTLFMTLYNKSKDTGMEIDTIIGDTAYSEKGNIELTKEESIQLVFRLNPVITQGNRTNENTFSFNKDAGMYVCRSGYMATRNYYENRESVGKNNRMVYFFDIEKCKQCPYKDGCYAGGKTKTYSETIKKHIYLEQEAFQESE